MRFDDSMTHILTWRYQSYNLQHTKSGSPWYICITIHGHRWTSDYRRSDDVRRQYAMHHILIFPFVWSYMSPMYHQR